jgi:hypothetical protein
MSTRRVRAALLRTLCFAVPALVFPSRARADVTSWFYAGGGVASSAMSGYSTAHPGTIALETGLGTPPDAAVVVGGLFKTLGYFGEGIDLGLTARVASGGFVRGGFGLALDLGGYERLWRQGSSGFLGSLVIGVPYGFQIAATTEIGAENVRVYGATVGIDFLRLTVYRTAAQNYWPNPFPPAELDTHRR